MKLFWILDPDPYNNSYGSASLFITINLLLPKENQQGFFAQPSLNRRNAGMRIDAAHLRRLSLTILLRAFTPSKQFII